LRAIYLTFKILNVYDSITYLQDTLVEVDGVNIWGSPWQPEFHNWAFNLPKNGLKLAEKWNNIPEFVDILITHGPAFGYLDVVEEETEHLGCELLAERIKKIVPKIHVCGHIHSGYGYKFDGFTHYINASVLSERYEYAHKPLTIDWDKDTNELIFL